MSTAPEQPVRVLSTLNEDGSRRWLRPRVSRGRFWKARRWTAYSLIAVFTLIPYFKVGDKPLVLLDVVRREFTIFGYTFLPTDTRLLALFLISCFVAIFLLTALFGRVWCGWACPQTVYLEFVYRPIERLFEGEPGRAPKNMSGGRKVLRFAVYLLVSMFIAHTFLAWFVGVDQLRHWILGSPANHPVAFLVMAAVTGLMLFDFGFFREQTCLIACPYGRFQSALLDRQSLIISYDLARGEPRGKAKRAPAGDVRLKVLPAADPAPRTGDCVDCGLCVTTCPTGIDIRDGLQMECVSCAQCIDACDAVMTKLNRPTGLIRYSSQAAMAGEKRTIVRPRVVLYPLLLTTLVTILVISLATKAPLDVTVVRMPGLPFNQLPSGEIANQLRLKVANRTHRPASYTVEVLGIEGAHVQLSEHAITADAGEQASLPVLVVAPRDAFATGTRDVRIRVTSSAGPAREVPLRLLGPAPHAPPLKDSAP